MYQSKIFSNGSTTLPKLVSEALSVKAVDRVRYVISEDGVQLLRSRSVRELGGKLSCEGQPPAS